MLTITVAFDTTPLIAEPTGIGTFVTSLMGALDPDEVRLAPWVLSRRAQRLPAHTVRLPWPAGPAVRWWGHFDRPRLVRSLAHADVVHATNYVAPPSGLPTVITVHDCTFLTHPLRCRPIVRAFGPLVRRRVAQGAWVHAPSTYVAEQAAELLGTDRVVAVHHGPPVLANPSGRVRTLPGLGGRPYVLALAAIEPRKNLPTLVRAFGMLHRELPDIALVLAGPNGMDRHAVDREIEDLPREAAERVVLTGWLEPAQRSAVLAGAAALAYPSLDEGFGLPVLEAFARRVPVVASFAGAIPEVAGDAALLVDPNDVDGLAGALSHVLTDGTTASALVARGTTRLRAFSWTASAHAITELYRRAAMDAAAINQAHA